MMAVHGEQSSSPALLPACAAPRAVCRPSASGLRLHTDDNRTGIHGVVIHLLLTRSLLSCLHPQLQPLLSQAVRSTDVPTGSPGPARPPRRGTSWAPGLLYDVSPVSVLLS